MPPRLKEETEGIWGQIIKDGSFKRSQLGLSKVCDIVGKDLEAGLDELITALSPCEKPIVLFQ